MGTYIGTCVDYNQSDPTSVGSYKWAKIKGENGQDGQDGVGIKSITKYYLASEKSTGITTSSSGWTTTIQTMTESKKYLWSYETIATQTEIPQRQPLLSSEYMAEWGRRGFRHYRISNRARKSKGWTALADCKRRAD